MSLQHLVDYFNDRFEVEDAGYRPFMLNQGHVSGRFGAVRVGSQFGSVRQIRNLHHIPIYIAEPALIDQYYLPTQAIETERMLTDAIRHPMNFVSLVDLDRICRIQHILNYLAIAHPDKALFLDVDPRHILAVDHNHGMYFEESILKCGLATKNVIISININDFYAPYHHQISYSLHNYRRRGYQIALNIGHHYDTKNLSILISSVKPDFLRLNAPNEQESDHIIRLNYLKNAGESVGSQTILQAINRQTQNDIAEKLGFQLVQGEYFEHLITDALRCA